MIINGNNVSVLPKEITEPWVEFSSLTSEQTGYYLGFVANVIGADHVVATIKRNGVPGGKPAKISGSRDSVVFFLGADADVAESADGIVIEGFDSSNKSIGKKEYNLTVAIN